MKGIQNEITVNKKAIHDYSKIASKYRSLRTTDLEPILHIKNKLNGKTRISIEKLHDHLEVHSKTERKTEN